MNLKGYHQKFEFQIFLYPFFMCADISVQLEFYRSPIFFFVNFSMV